MNLLRSYRHGVDALPPHFLILLAVVAIQLGASASTHLFPLIGVEGAVALRIIVSAILLWLFTFRRRAVLFAGFKQHWRMVLLFGICMASMNFFFFKAIDRIPLGVAVALEFIGPLSVSAFYSKRRSHLLWVAIAATGIALLTPITGAKLDGLGVIFALLSGTGWAVFVILSRRVSGQLEDNDGLVLGMSVAAVLMLPFAATISIAELLDPQVLVIGFLVASLSTAIPFTLEFEALKRLSATSYGVLVSTEPAVAALVGAVVLDELIGLRGLLAVACVVIAALGVTLSDARNNKSA